MRAREHVVGILAEFERRSTSIDHVMTDWFSYYDIDKRDRRLVHELVYGVIRNRSMLDWVLKAYIANPKFMRNEELLRILRLGAYQIIHLDKIPLHAAVNESVEICKKDHRISPMSGLVNAVLRKIAAHKDNLPLPGRNEPLLTRLCVTYSHPEWIVERWIAQFGEARTKRLLEFNNTPPVITMRRSIRGVSRQAFEHELREICDVKSGGRGFMDLYYPLTARVMPEDVPAFREGYCTVQAEPSGWAVAMLDVKQGDRVLDICSAPGGKSALIAELVGEKGYVCAGEVKPVRMHLTVDTAARMGLHSVLPVACDGHALPFAKIFDKVLLDAPCSGTGVMNRHPDARWHRTAADIDRVVKLQSTLLDGAAHCVIKGGILVYSTCSIEPAENREQVDAFLARNADFILDDAPDAVPKNITDRSGCLTITPFDQQMDGMYAARLRRIA